MNIKLLMIGLLIVPPVWGEVITDGSVGPALSLPGPDFEVSAELGLRQGANLFHSFSQFNLAANESALFTGPDAVTNIIGRVTGGSPSEIRGLLRSTIPGADLYLANPAGMVLGENASLDIQGSFYATTADSLVFPDGVEWATGKPDVSRFSSASPSAFGFLDAPAGLEITGGALRVPRGETLLLAGGEVSIKTSHLEAPGGRLALVSVGGAGGISRDGEHLDAPGGKAVVHDSLLDASGEGGGGIKVRTGDMEMRDSQFQADSLGAGDGEGIDARLDNLSAEGNSRWTSHALGTGNSGDIHIQARGNLEFNGAGATDIAGILTWSGEERGAQAGNSGAIRLEVGALKLIDGSAVETTSHGAGKAGDLSIQARESVLVTGESPNVGYVSAITTEAQGRGGAGDLHVVTPRLVISRRGLVSTATWGEGAGGNLEIKTDTLEVTDQGLLETSTFGPARAGNLTIEASERVHVIGTETEQEDLSTLITTESGTLEDSDQENTGQAGDLWIKTPILAVSRGGIVSTSSFSEGPGGHLNIEAGEWVRVEENALIDAGTYLSGRGGNLHIVAPKVEVIRDGKIHTATQGAGASGHLSIETEQLKVLEGGLIDTSTYAEGRAGDLTIQTRHLEVSSGGWIDASSFGEGNAGNLSIHACGAVVLEGGNENNPSSMTAKTWDRGDAGNLTLRAERLTLLNGGLIAASTDGEGKGGSLTLEVASEIRLSGATPGSGDSRISVLSALEDSGAAGNIRLETSRLVLDQGARITSQSEGADGGDLILRIKDYAYLRNSGITTAVKARQGDGGNIDISPGFIILDVADPVVEGIHADAFEGNGGNIYLQTHGIYQFDDFSPEEVITASSEKGVAGEIRLALPETDIAGSLVLPPGEFMDVSALQNTPCTRRERREASKFTARSYLGGLIKPVGFMDWWHGRGPVTPSIPEQTRERNRVP